MALLQMFYILHGVVYPTSTPLLLVESRLSRASHHLTTALSLTRKRCVDMLAADDDVSADDMMPPISMGSGQVMPSNQSIPPILEGSFCVDSRRNTLLHYVVQ